MAFTGVEHTIEHHADVVRGDTTNVIGLVNGLVRIHGDAVATADAIDAELLVVAEVVKMPLWLIDTKPP